MAPFDNPAEDPPSAPHKPTDGTPPLWGSGAPPGAVECPMDRPAGTYPASLTNPNPNDREEPTYD
jgi:hypothetical protein